VDTGGKKTAAAIHAEITREIDQWLHVLFVGRRKTGYLDFEASEMMMRSAVHRVVAPHVGFEPTTLRPTARAFWRKLAAPVDHRRQRTLERFATAFYLPSRENVAHVQAADQAAEGVGVDVEVGGGRSMVAPPAARRR
jgi:hypothetical protein